MEGKEMQRTGVSSLASDLDALANEQRLTLLSLLTRPKYGEEIARELGISRQSALRHIQRLMDRGFVRALAGNRQSGPVVEYQVVPQRLFSLGVAIDDLGKLETEGGPLIKRNEPTLRVDIAKVASDLAPTPPTTRLVLVSGPTAGAAFPFSAEKHAWTVGRDTDRAVCLKHDPFISGRHAEVQLERNGYALVDAHSANGTFLNFARLPKGARVPLKPGDVIGVGHSFLVFQREPV